MPLQTFQIRQFYGIQQQSDGSLLNEGSAYDMRNMTTLDGNLAVCKGFEQYIKEVIPSDSGRYLKLCVVRLAEPKFIVVTSKYIYRWSGVAWVVLYTFSPELKTRQIDYMQTRIGLTDYVLISTGETPIIKVAIDGWTASEFGSGATSYTGTITAYNSEATTTVLGTLTVDLNTFRVEFPQLGEYKFVYSNFNNTNSWRCRQMESLGAVTTILDASVSVIKATFKTMIDTVGIYTFTYDGEKWKYGDENANLYEYGIVLDLGGTQPAASDTIVVIYEYVETDLATDGIELTGTPTVGDEIIVYNGAASVTIAPALSELAESYAKIDGISLGDYWYDVTDIESDEFSTTFKIDLVDTDMSPQVGDDVSVRGGGSDAHVNFIDIYYSRLFSAGDPDAPNRLYYSAAVGSGRTFEDWLSVDGSADASGGYIEIGDAGGDDIVGIIVLSNQILIFKRYSVYRLYGNRPSQYAVERIENFAEIMSNSSCVVKYGVPYYLTRTGIKTYDGTGVQHLNEGVRVIGRFLENIVSVLDSKAVHSDNVLYFTCKCNKDSDYDDTVIVYDIPRQSITVRDGFEIADIAQYDSHIYIIDGDGYVCEFNKGDTFNGKKIVAYWETQHTDLGLKAYKKQITSILLRGSGNEFNVKVVNGGNEWVQHYRWTDATIKDIACIDVQLDLGTTFYVRLYNEEGSHFEIDGGMDIVFERQMKIR